MNIKVKLLHENSVLPKKTYYDDAGFDLVATSCNFDNKKRFIEYGTGIAIEIPKGYVGLLFPRSSVTKETLMLKNSVGVIDSGYLGEIMVRFAIIPNRSYSGVVVFDHDNKFSSYQVGDKIAQLIIMPIPHIELEEVNTLSTSERGAGGFGSTGR
jgi:dUTP pyrophosphatase